MVDIRRGNILMTSASILALREKIRRDTGKSLQTAQIESADTTRPGFVIVRFQSGGGTLSGPQSVKLPSSAGVAVTAGNVVRIGYDANTGEQVIIDGDIAGQVAVGIAPEGGRDTVTTRYVSSYNFGALKCYALATEQAQSLTVAVSPGWYILDGRYTQFAGATIDLTSLVPAANQHAWIVILLTRDGALEAFSSTVQNALDPLTDADVREALAQKTPGSIPVWGWLLANAQATINGSDLNKQLDLRQFIDVDSSANAPTTPTVIDFPTLIAANRQLRFFDGGTTNSHLVIDGHLVSE